MWYVKDEFTDKIYFCSSDVRETQRFAIKYNKTFKFSSQRIFKFTLDTFSFICFFGEDKIDVNFFTAKCSIFTSNKFYHPLSVKGFNKKHIKYRTDKYLLIKKLCKKYHLWSYNSSGRKCDGFDF